MGVLRHSRVPATERRMGNNKGFTLIEILVVIIIIMLLATIGIVGLGNLRERTKINNTKALLEQIKGGLDAYWNTFQQTYPPSEGQWDGSQNLYYYLAEPIEYTGNVDPKTGVGTAMTFEPPLTLKSSQVDGEKYLLDAWENRIYYKKPGTHTSFGGSKNPFDLASWGPNGKEDAEGSPDKPGDNDDITNWEEEK